MSVLSESDLGKLRTCVCDKFEIISFTNCHTLLFLTSTLTNILLNYTIIFSKFHNILLCIALTLNIEEKPFLKKKKKNGFIPCKAEQPLTRKRNTKRLRHTGNLFRKNLHLQDVY